MNEAPHYDLHLFVCTNRKAEGKESCAPKGSEALRDRVKATASASAGQAGKIRINASGCLGQCSRGIAAVCYPQGVWLLDLADDEASEKKLLGLIRQDGAT